MPPRRVDSFGLWPDKRLLRGFQRCVQLVSEIDLQEYSLDVNVERMSTANVNEIIFLCQQARQSTTRGYLKHATHAAMCRPRPGDRARVSDAQLLPTPPRRRMCVP